MILGIAGSILALGLLLLVLAVLRERRLLEATTREAADAVAYLQSRADTLDEKLKQLGRLDDIAALFAEPEPEAASRSGSRRRGRQRKRRSRP